MKFVPGDSKPRQNNPGYSKKIYLDEKELNHPGALVQQLNVPAGQRADVHYHKVQTEIFYFFDDTGYRIVNGETIRPKAGDVLVIEPNDNHTAVNETDHDYLYICFKLNRVPDDFYLSE